MGGTGITDKKNISVGLASGSVLLSVPVSLLSLRGTCSIPAEKNCVHNLELSALYKEETTFYNASSM